jgi:hypothetical protein
VTSPSPFVAAANAGAALDLKALSLLCIHSVPLGCDGALGCTAPLGFGIPLAIRLRGGCGLGGSPLNVPGTRKGGRGGCGRLLGLLLGLLLPVGVLPVVVPLPVGVGLPWVLRLASN